MNSARTSRGVLLVLALGLAVPGAASADATRTWVSGTGDDANVSNDCSRTAPCATLTGALSATTPGGEVNAINAGDYGAVTVDRAVTIDLGPSRGSVTNDGGGTGIVVDAAPTDEVVLRDIDILGGGNTCPRAGAIGIDVQSARSVSVEDSQIGTQDTAVQVDPTAGNPQVALDDVAIKNNCSAGLSVAPPDGQTAAVVVRNSTISQSGTAVLASGSSHTWLFGSGIFDNTVGLQATGAAEIDTDAYTYFAGNGSDGTPNHVVGTGPAGVAGAPGGTGATGATGPSGANGSTGAAAFKVTLPSTSLTGTAGKTVKLSYRTTAAARTTLSVIHGKKVVARVSARARNGRNSVFWNGRIRGRAAPAGHYKLMLSAVGSGGEKTSKTARLKLRR